MISRLATPGLLAFLLLAGCGPSGDPDAPAADAASDDPDTEMVEAVSGKTRTGAEPGGAAAESYEGRLQEGDATLRSGEYADEYKVDVEAGQWIDVRMTSSDFDPYLIVVAPSGGQEDNDDEDRTQGTAARVRTQAAESGLYSVRATSFQPGESGAYTVSVSIGGDAADAVGPVKPDRSLSGLPTPAVSSDPGGRVERGALAAGDATLRSGEFYDVYTLQGQAGDRVVLDMTSSAFDPYLILWMPDGTQEDNDDFEGSTAQSRIAMVLPAAGAYRVGATSYAPGMTGDYELVIQQEAGQGSTQGGAVPLGRPPSK